ncbi:hypothetical protein WJX84_000683 [Apatococcus fuscideae]|uniref:Large ribosomal subunit protein mL54 n=1 Tax=Apatococcus fuscideae TaxID=2026836 RepID=A0AAW1TE69_9CHLO
MISRFLDRSRATLLFQNYYLREKWEMYNLTWLASFSTSPAAGAEAGSKSVPGLNIKKSGSDPELKEDSEYPDWLWELSKRDISLYELNKQNEEDLEFPQLARKLKLSNRNDIRDRNTSKAKR